MKPSSLILSILMTGFLSSFANAHGGSAEGGGHTQISLSTPEQVSKAIDNAKVEFSEQFRSGSLWDMAQPYDQGRRNRARSGQPARLLEIVDQLIEQARAKRGMINNLVQNLVAETKIEKRTSGSCSEDSNLEGFVKMDDPDSPICFSVELLQKIPTSLLKSQVLALTAHEFMHKLGYQEADAHLMQMYFLAEVATGLEWGRRHYVDYFEAADRSVKGIKEDMKKRDFDGVCMDLHDLDGQLRAARKTLTDFYKDKEDPTVEPKKLEQVRKLMGDYQSAWSSVQPMLESPNQYGSRGQGLSISEAFCMRRLNQRQMWEYVSKLEPFFQPMINITTTIFPPGLTVAAPRSGGNL